MRYFLVDGAWLSGEPALWLVGWNFQFHTLTTKEKEERNWRLNSVTSSQWFNHSCLHNEASVKTPNTGVGEHIKVLGGLCAPEGVAALHLLPYFALYISSFWLFPSCILYNKSVIVSNKNSPPKYEEMERLDSCEQIANQGGASLWQTLKVSSEETKGRPPFIEEAATQVPKQVCWM